LQAALLQPIAVDPNLAHPGNVTQVIPPLCLVEADLDLQVRLQLRVGGGTLASERCHGRACIWRI